MICGHSQLQGHTTAPQCERWWDGSLAPIETLLQDCPSDALREVSVDLEATTMFHMGWYTNAGYPDRYRGRLDAVAEYCSVPRIEPGDCQLKRG